MENNYNYSESLKAEADKYRQEIKSSDWATLNPPYLPKTVTHLRSKYFHEAKEKLLDGKYSHSSSAQVSRANRFLLEFTQQFDGDVLDWVVGHLREPYIKKMLESNYQFDQIDIKKANTEYMLKTEIEEMTGFACQWLLQVELTCDLVERASLYFGIALKGTYEDFKDKLTSKDKFSMTGASLGLLRKSFVFLLKRVAQLLDIYGKSQIQTLFPSLFLMVFSVVGGSVPWAIKLPKLSTAVLAGSLFGPMVLNNIAEQVTKTDVQSLMKRLSSAMASTANNLAEYNQLITDAIKDCAMCHELGEFQKKRQVLAKFLGQLNEKEPAITEYDEEKFDKIRQTVDEQFAKYYEIQYKNSSWTMIFTEQDFELYKQAIVQLQGSIDFL